MHTVLASVPHTYPHTHTQSLNVWPLCKSPSGAHQPSRIAATTLQSTLHYSPVDDWECLRTDGPSAIRQHVRCALALRTLHRLSPSSTLSSRWHAQTVIGGANRCHHIGVTHRPSLMARTQAAPVS
jgi:hypothetical protein